MKGPRWLFYAVVSPELVEPISDGPQVNALELDHFISVSFIGKFRL